MTVRQYSIVGEIHRVFIKHGCLTDEGLDVILNYYIKYRMGGEADGEEESNGNGGAFR